MLQSATDPPALDVDPHAVPEPFAGCSSVTQLQRFAADVALGPRSQTLRDQRTFPFLEGMLRMDPFQNGNLSSSLSHQSSN